MKKIVFVSAIAIFFLFASEKSFSQIVDPKEKVQEGSTDRVNNNIDNGVNKGLDNAEEGIKNLFRKKDKPKKDDSQNQQNENKNSTEGNSPATKQTSETTTSEASLKSYSKFDFIPGEQIIFFDDFSQDAVGDFPVKWNTNGNGEVVTSNVYSGKWLKMRNSTTYLPEISSKKFPDNYTLEYDMIANGENRHGSFSVELTALENKNKVPDASDPTNNTGLLITMEMNADGLIRYLIKSTINIDGNPTDGGANTDINDNTIGGKAGEKFHVSVTVNKQRLRFYVNEVKVLDLPKVIPSGNYNAVIFRMWGWSEDHSFDALLSNFRYAEGTPDMRSKLITEGKLVTHGILFDVNSDKIKAESYGTLKEISQVLKDNAGVKIKIIGHTDGDGNASSNLDLSKRRAAAVKISLSKDFGIDASRIETDGRGASEPASPNTTPEGKANNRRVEFVKM